MLIKTAIVRHQALVNMELQRKINTIFEKLSILSTEIRLRGGFNMLDINVVSESFFAELMNRIFGYHLSNLNLSEQNAKSIDLIDPTNKLIVQVSSDNSKKKVQTSLSGIDNSKYDGYHFLFVSIAKEVSHLKKEKFAPISGISFAPDTDCYDIKSLIKLIEEKGSDCVQNVSEYLSKTVVYTEKKDVRPEAITYVIKQLADIDLSELDNEHWAIPFDIQPKIDKNKLQEWDALIKEYAVYSTVVGKIYKDYDQECRNQSMAVLFRLKSLYLKLKQQFVADELFDKLKEEVYKIVDGDATCSTVLTKEQLEMNISIVLIDAFMKCKIFEKP